MRIVSGAWRGRKLQAPEGLNTRPTADRVRQAVFDMLMHAPWGGGDRLRQARVLDAFAGTGALGLEALSRGAVQAVFMENAPVALACLRANIAACRAQDRCMILTKDLRQASRPAAEQACDLVFLDPPYGADLVRIGLTALHGAGWLTDNAIVIGEFGRTDPLPDLEERLGPPVALRTHGAAQIAVWQRQS